MNSRKLGQLASGVVASVKRRLAAGDGPYRPGAQLGFGKVSKAAGNDPNISDATYRVLGLIAAYADSEGYCHPAVGTIAAQRGVSRQAIQHHLRTLVANRYLEVTQQKRKNGGYGPNRYRVAIQYAPATVRNALKAMNSSADTHPHQISARRASDALDSIEGEATSLACIEEGDVND